MKVMSSARGVFSSAGGRPIAASLPAGVSANLVQKAICEGKGGVWTDTNGCAYSESDAGAYDRDRWGLWK